MYTTIEADIEPGRVRSSELQRLPSIAHVLITLLPSPVRKHADWDVIKAQIGKLRIRENTVGWQRKIRSEWS